MFASVMTAMHTKLYELQHSMAFWSRRRSSMDSQAPRADTPWRNETASIVWAFESSFASITPAARPFDYG